MPPGVTPFPKHCDGKRFFNPDAPQARGFPDVLRWKFTTRPQSSPRFVSDVVPSKPPAGIDGSELQVTLVNHSTVLLQQSGLHILTDPIWSERATPVKGIGPRRRRAPGVLWEDLPRIDIVLLSHNHYDHLDLPTLRRIAARGQAQFVVPTGVAGFLRHQLRREMRQDKPDPVHELDWGESVSMAGTTIHSVPALHFSARGIFDRNRTLWCGYVFEAANRVVYYAGDTAFGSHFAMFREGFGAPHLALLQIGAYEPRWFMSPIHMDPDDAIQAHRILGAGTSIAIHHGTFQLADESLDTPRLLLNERAIDNFLVLNNGQSVTLA